MLLWFLFCGFGFGHFFSAKHHPEWSTGSRRQEITSQTETMDCLSVCHSRSRVTTHIYVWPGPAAQNRMLLKNAISGISQSTAVSALTQPQSTVMYTWLLYLVLTSTALGQSLAFAVVPVQATFYLVVIRLRWTLAIIVIDNIPVLTGTLAGRVQLLS